MGMRGRLRGAGRDESDLVIEWLQRMVAKELLRELGKVDPKW